MVFDILSAIDATFDLDTDALESVSLDQIAAALGLAVTSDTPTETLSTATPLSLVEIFSPGFSQTFDSTIALLETATGTLTVDSGTLSGTVTTSEGTETIDLDGNEFFDALLADAETLTVDATLTGGVFAGTLTREDGSSFATNLDAGSLLDSTVTTLLNQTDAVVPFANGQFAIDVPTSLGDVTGSLDFAGGDLNLDLSTPLGDLDIDYDFPIDAAIPFDVDSPLGPLMGSLDFASGQVVVPLTAGGMSLGILSVALEDLSGQVSLQDGTASLSVELPDLGFIGLPETLTTDIDLGPLASELVEGFTDDTTGSLSIASGQATASITSPLGSLDTTFSFADLTREAVDFLTATTGSLTLDNGSVTALLDTPLGTVDTLTTVADIDDFFMSPFLV